MPKPGVFSGLALVALSSALGCGSPTTGSRQGPHVDGGPETGGSSNGGSSGSASGGTAGSGSGGTAGGSGGSGGTGGAAGGAGTGGSPMDHCTANTDCPGGACFRLLAGNKDCVKPKDAPVLNACDFAPPPCCTKDADCTDGKNGRCWPKFDVAENFCGGAVPQGNDCRYDLCSTDADCAQKPAGATVATCLPAGALGTYFAQCAYGGCRTNADCTAHPGGVCSYGLGPTHGACNLVNELYCAYPSDPCGNPGQDCPTGKVCTPKDDYQGRECGQGPPMYP